MRNKSTTLWQVRHQGRLSRCQSLTKHQSLVMLVRQVKRLQANLSLLLKTNQEKPQSHILPTLDMAF